jgi:hypothetical protein
MRSAIKMYQHNIIVTAVPSIKNFQSQKHMLMNYRLSKFGRLNNDRTANLRPINCVLPCPQTYIQITTFSIKVYYRICTVRHIRIKIFYSYINI